MPNDPNPPENEKWKKFTRTLIHALYFILALMLLAAALYLDNFAVYGILIAVCLIVIEKLYFSRLKKPCKARDFVKRYLGFLTSVAGRGVLYQLLGYHYLKMGRWWSWGSDYIWSIPFTIWFIGLCLTALAVTAKAYNFTDWIEDEEDEGELRLESDDEGDLGIGVLCDEAAVV